MLASRKNIRLHGTSIAPGLAMGKAFVYYDDLEENPEANSFSLGEEDVECERVQLAVERVVRDLQESSRQVTKQIGPYQAEILETQKIMLEELLESREIRSEMLKERVKAEIAVQRVFRRWVNQMRQDESTRFIQRAEDVADLGRRLVRALKEVTVHPLENMPADSVLIASRLLPSDAIFFAERHAAAIVVEFGAAGSHCALLTRQIGIPGVASKGATREINTGDIVLVDGFRATVVVDPDKEVQATFEKRIAGYHEIWTEAKNRCHDPAITGDGVRVPVMANIANRADAQVAVANGADGIGLYRLEALLMLLKALPSEDELLRMISEVLLSFKNRPSIVRLLDVSSEKQLPYLPFPAEPAPCLGMRGVRVLLRHPELLNVQLRALLRLAQTQEIQIMVPMITIPEDMQAVRNAVESQASELDIAAIPPLVAMIETPAAALRVPEILRFADALSLGTNDLAQYTLAAGRQNPLVQRYFRDDDPAVLRLIRLAVEEADGALVGICGELAGQPEAIPMLLDAGVRLLSVAPPLVPATKESVRRPDIWHDRPVSRKAPRD